MMHAKVETFYMKYELFLGVFFNIVLTKSAQLHNLLLKMQPKALAPFTPVHANVFFTFLETCALKSYQNQSIKREN